MTKDEFTALTAQRVAKQKAWWANLTKEQRAAIDKRRDAGIKRYLRGKAELKTRAR